MNQMGVASTGSRRIAFRILSFISLINLRSAAPSGAVARLELFKRRSQRTMTLHGGRLQHANFGSGQAIMNPVMAYAMIAAVPASRA